MKSELNKRQWALYNFLKEQGDEWKTQAEIATLIPEYNYNGEEDWRLFHDNPARHIMTADIRAINESTVIQKVIISSGKGIKIANKEEFALYIRKERMAAIRRLVRVRIKERKGRLDGQTRITFGAYERDTVKAFLDSDKSVGERLRELRHKNGFKASSVCTYLSKAGVKLDEPMLSRFENGYCLPNKRTIENLAQFYAVSVDYILTGNLSTDEETSENDGLQAVKEG